MTPGLRRLSGLPISAVALVGVLLLTSCSGSSGGATSPQLQSKLLGSTEIPAGWVVQDIPGNGIGCLANLIEPEGIAITTSTDISFADGGSDEGLPEVVERLATYRDTDAAYQAIVAGLDNCKQVNGEIDGVALSGALVPVTYGHYGSTSAAFAATFTTSAPGDQFAVDHQLGDDVAIVQRGKVVLGIDEGGYAPIDAGQFSAIVSAAAKKLG